MNNKKTIMYFGIIIFIIVILIAGYFILKNKNKTEIIEYVPQEEITEQQMRNTIVTLYFMDINTGNLMAEARQIDVKELINNPYSFLVQLLINGPKNENLIKLIPDNTILNSAELVGNIAYLDFNEKLIDNQMLGEKQEKLIINSIVNTLTELTEVEAIIITINGEKDLSFPDNCINFSQEFKRN